MKKILVLLFVLVLSITSFAQLDVSPNSFKQIEGFVNDNPDIQTDDNNKPFAVIKMKTENIDEEQRRQLHFGGDLQTYFEVEEHGDELWLYISYYATYIKISHPDFGTTEFWFPFSMRGKKGYEMTLVNKLSNFSGNGSLYVVTKPEPKATVTINGQVMSEKTAYRVPMIAAGEYKITVSKEGYEDVTENVTIYDGDNIDLEIEMPLLKPRLEIKTSPDGAAVYIDGEFLGYTPQKTEKIAVGKHTLTLKMPKRNTFTKEFEIEPQKLTRFDVYMNTYPKDVVPNEFSIAENKKVFFSKENLKYNASDKNAGKNGKWRAPSIEEWKYLLFDRYTIYEGMRVKTGEFKMAKVGDKKGLILLSDLYTWFDFYFMKTWSEYSLADFENVLEPHGAVFLPQGKYYSSTKGKCIIITEDDVYEADDTGSTIDYVRLITPVK